MSSAPSSKAQQTRERILFSAAQLIHAQGYHNTGLQQIIDSASVTKGAFYFHFKDKKALALEVIALFGQVFVDQLGAELGNSRLSALQRLESFHRNACAAFTTQDAIAGCPIGNLTLELAAIDNDLRQSLAARFEHMVEVFSKVIAEGQASGEITAELDARALAEFFVSSWEGAVLRSKASQRTDPLDNWFALSWSMLAAKPVPATSTASRAKRKAARS